MHNNFDSHNSGLFQANRQLSFNLLVLNISVCLCLISLVRLHLHTVKSFISNINPLFSFPLEQWYELPNFPNPNKWGYSLVSLNNDVYVSGGTSVCKESE